MLEVLDNGADDFISDEEYIEVLCDPKVFSDLLESLQEKGIKLEEAQIKQIPNIKKESIYCGLEIVRSNKENNFILMTLKVQYDKFEFNIFNEFDEMESLK